MLLLNQGSNQELMSSHKLLLLVLAVLLSAGAASSVAWSHDPGIRDGVDVTAMRTKVEFLTHDLPLLELPRLPLNP